MNQTGINELEVIMQDFQFIRNQQHNLTLEHLGIKKTLQNELSKAIDSGNNQLKLLIEDKYNKASLLTLEKGNNIIKALSEVEGRLNLLVLNKKVSTAVIVFNELWNKILLIKRSQDDEFCPNTWCLPGGGMDINSPYEEAKREVKEETNLDIDNLNFIKSYDLENITLLYFKGCVKEFDVVTIDNSEHQKMEWVALDQLSKYDLILDLGSHLSEILNIEIPRGENLPNMDELNQKLEIIEKAFKEGKVSQDILNQVIEVDLTKGVYPIGQIRVYEDGSAWRKLKHTNSGIGDWVKISHDEAIKEMHDEIKATKDPEPIPTAKEEAEEHAETYEEIVDDVEKDGKLDTTKEEFGEMIHEDHVKDLPKSEDYTSNLILDSIISILPKNEEIKILLSNNLSRLTEYDRELAEKWLEDYLNNWDLYNKKDEE